MSGPMSSQGTKFMLGDPLTFLPATAATKATPAVVTVPNTTLDVGDYAYVQNTGWSSLDNKVWKVEAKAGVAGSETITLEGSDTTGEVPTFGADAEVSEPVDYTEVCFATISRESPAAGVLDVTTLCDNVRKQLTGLKNNGTFTLNGFYDPGSAGQIALREAYDLGDQRAIRIIPPDGSMIDFVGQVNQLSETFGVDQPVAITAGGIINGGVTYTLPPP